MDYGTSLCIVGELTLQEGLAKVSAAGFKQVELSSWDTPVGVWRHEVELARRLLEAAGLTARSAHVPSSGWDCDAPDEATRLASIEAASSIFRPAAELGVRVVVCHANAPYSHGFTDEDYEASVARSVASLRALAERAADAGLALAVENLPLRHAPRPSGSVEELFRMIDGLGDHVGICLDAGHANANGRSAAEEARIAGERLFAVHLADNDGLGEDQHLIPGDGTTDWDALLTALDEVAPECVRNFEVPYVEGEVDERLRRLAELRRRWEAR